MLDRENGELLLDIGITHHPVCQEPLVGIWRLDCLEASFGAGGFNRGNLHTLNTLSLYGGLQAEMEKARAERTHVAFRSSYNLAYEVTRKLDNSRDLFKDQDAYSVNDIYLGDIQDVINIYEDDASFKTFGVRDEIRVGGQTLGDIQQNLPEKVGNKNDIHIPLLLTDHPATRTMPSLTQSLSSGSHPRSGLIFWFEG